MARYALNLPRRLKQDAEEFASREGISLNQFVLWAVAEKVGDLRSRLDDPAFPHITYRRGASGQPVPVIRGTGIRAQTVVVATRQWGLTPAQVAAEYGLAEIQVKDALAFYESHCAEIEGAIETEAQLEMANG